MPRGDKKAYATVLARIPHDLVAAVKQYASQHRCRVSELIRDGLEMRVEEDIPGRAPGPTGRSRDAGEEVLQEVLQAIKALAPMGQAAVRQTIREVLHEVLPQYVSKQQGQRHDLTEGVPRVPTILTLATDEGHTSTPQPSTHRTEQGHTEVLQTTGAAVPAFDPQRYIVGKLCKRGHEYGTTGQSLLTRVSRHCPQCDTEQARERRARRKVAQPQEG